MKNAEPSMGNTITSEGLRRKTKKIKHKKQVRWKENDLIMKSI